MANCSYSQSQNAKGTNPLNMEVTREPVKEVDSGPTGIKSPTIDITMDNDDDERIKMIEKCNKRIGRMVGRFARAQQHVNRRIYHFCFVCSGKFIKRSDLIIHLRMTHKILIT